MRTLALLFLLFVPVAAIQINFNLINGYLYQTNITVGKQNLTVLLDFTGSQLWLFGSKNATAKFDNSLLNLGNQTNMTALAKPNVLNFTNPVYDANFNVTSLNTGNSMLVIDGNKTVGMTNFSVVLDTNYTALRTADRILGAGIMGVGNPLGNMSNYLSTIFNSTSKIVLCTRPPYKQAVLIINEPYFNASILANATVTKLTNVSTIKPGAFEFSMSAVRIGYSYMKIAPMPAIISTLNNYLSVDRDTWNFIRMAFRPATDRRTSKYFVDCLRMRQLKLYFAVNTVNNTRSWLMVPGNDLVVPTDSGYCSLKLRPSNGEGWILGAPFIRHHCIQVDLAKQQLVFVNNSIFYPTSPKKFLLG